MKKIKYFSTIGGDGDTDVEYLPSDYLIPPEKRIVEVDKNHMYSKCPALKEWGKNTWIVYQPFNIEIEYISAEKRLIGNLVQSAFDNYIHLESYWLDGKNPNVQFNDFYLFWTEEKDVWVEQIPHPLISRYGIGVIPGTFPISVWQRPITCGFDILDYDVNIKIPRGTPLYYVRFYSRKSDSLFSLNKEPLPKKMLEFQKQHTRLKDYAPQESWNLIKDRLKKEESSCPFNFLRRK